MYAIIKTGGKQYKVEKGDNLVVEKLKEAGTGQEVVLNEVLLLAEGEKVTIGKPVIEGANVIAKVISQKRSPKVLVFKRKPKKGYKKLQGHRQYVTELEITEINA
ncbi:50S ribosomal protein L21 [Candidatus Endomicrobiellum agilis]|jgi:large subunit ribosomal protein L21|uniref:50S ribosomal protein L21 n=1 Tax=Candidatus Endomicrobiellum agilis TaxID=3238957 RepID=UPI002848855C|nr:50S ribosomal protein L21 [Endomicrobium sp.]MDR3092870.1 50S ribosomal protein L21 [Endomicrobium sp.]